MTIIPQMKLKLKLFGGLILTFALSYWLIKPLFNQGLFPIHDDTQVGRIIQMKKALRDGHFPVRWSTDLGYGFGYPLFNFYAPLPYYLGGLIAYLSGNPMLATKIMYAVGIIISGISMYLFMQDFFGILPAILSATLFMYAPYHAVQIYVRGSVGEYWAYGLIPLVSWGFYQIIRKKSFNWVIINSFFIALFILSHNIVSMLLVSILFLILITSLIYSLILNPKSKFNWLVPTSIIIGLLLSAFFWLPAIFESRYTNVSSLTLDGSVFSDHFLYLDQLWDSPWGFAGSAPGRADGMSFKLGKIQIISGILGLLSVIFLKIKKKINRINFNFCLFILFILCFSLLMVLEVSLPIWKLGSYFLKYVQFPWRFLVFISFSLSFFAIFFLAVLKKGLRILIGTIFIILVIVINSKYFQPQYFLDLTNKDYQSDEYLKWVVSKISDEYLPKEFIRPQNKDLIAKSLFIDQELFFDYNLIEEKTGKIRLSLNNNFQQEIILARTYFPSWVGFSNNRMIKIKNIRGLISFIVPEGKNEVVLIFKSTPTQMVANTLTVITFLGVLLYLERHNKKEKKFRLTI